MAELGTSSPLFVVRFRGITRYKISYSWWKKKGIKQEEIFIRLKGL